MTDHPLKPVRRHCLGEPLPHQLADTVQADLEAINISLAYLCIKGISGFTSRFQQLSPSSRHITYILLTRAPLVSRVQVLSVTVRLACVKHAASVRSEPGSNSSV